MITIKIKESKYCNEQYSMFVSFEYNQKVVDTIRSLPTRSLTLILVVSM